MARARYTVIFRSTSCKISFKDKALEGEPDSRHTPTKAILTDPYISKEIFIRFVKDYISEKAQCHPSAVMLRWEKWLPLWGEPWQ